MLFGARSERKRAKDSRKAASGQVAASRAEELLDFIRESPSPFHAVAAIRARLDAAGFTYLPEGSAWDVRPGGSYYTQRNGSSIIAWQVGSQVSGAPDCADEREPGTSASDAASGSAVATAAGDVAPGTAAAEAKASAAHAAVASEGRARPGRAVAAEARAGVAHAIAGAKAKAARAGAGAQDGAPYYFKLTASHSDAPTFKLKSACALEGPDDYLRLATEAYGGMMDYTWFDRPLSLAGRVLVRDGSRIESRLVALNRDVALIPSLAIHMDREVNKGFAPNRARGLFPVASVGDMTPGSLDTLVADSLDIEPGQIAARDLFLVNRQEPCVWGATDEFVSAPKLDDLMCAFTSLEAFLASAGASRRDIKVFACFDNEEVGSETKQGAASTFLYDVLSRANDRLGFNDEDLRRALSASILVSCDNAHAVHPAHPDVADQLNRPHLNRGLVVKEAANQHYCTDAFSRAALTAVLDDAGVPYQSFANRSDMAGGSTLGNISNMQVSVHTVDVGCAQLAMHSSYETAGARDVDLAIDALTAFYQADFCIDGADSITL